jgi:hypothetical protein
LFRFVFVRLETFLTAVTDDLLVGVLVSIGEVDRLGMFTAAAASGGGSWVVVAVSFEDGFDPGW